MNLRFVPMWLQRLVTASSDAAASLLVARVVQIGSGFLVSILIVQMYGLDGAGTYALAVLPAAAVTHLCTLGLPSELARSELPLGQRATVAVIASFAALFLLAPVAAAYGAVVGKDEAEAAAIAVFAWSAAGVGQIGVSQTVQVLQARARFAVVVPLLQLGAVVIAAIAADSLLQFAWMIAIGRVVASLAGFATVSYARARFDSLVSTIRKSLHFVPIDILSAASELVVIPLLAGSLTRSELGIFGLARQFLMVADSPGWSFVQSRYPELATNLRQVAPQVRWSNLRISVAAGVSAMIGGSAMALLFYQAPGLIPVLLIMLLGIPARYENNFYDQALRAAGEIRTAIKLALIKLAGATALIMSLALSFGLYGAAVGILLASVGSALLYARRYSATLVRSGATSARSI